jgi:hypothetical protein
MSDSKSGRLSLELITNCMNEVAREFEVLDHDDRRRAAIIEELCLLTNSGEPYYSQVSRLVEQSMDEVAREMVTLKQMILGARILSKR